MAKSTGPAFSINAQGKFASTVIFTDNKGSKRVKKYTVPKNPKSTDQTTQRNYMKEAVLAWKTDGYNALDIEAWNYFAKIEKKNLSGYNKFLGYRINQEKKGEDWWPLTNCSIYDVTGSGCKVDIYGEVEKVTKLYAGVSKYYLDKCFLGVYDTDHYTFTVIGLLPNTLYNFYIESGVAEKYISWKEEKPAGDLNKPWRGVDISGDKMIAPVFVGRLYYYNGVSWSEQQPAGDLDLKWIDTGISGDRIIAAISSGRLYYYDGVSWSEQQPGGNLDLKWSCVDIDGLKMLAAIRPGRLYYFNGVSWSEQQPAGVSDEYWSGVSISGDKMIVCAVLGRVYYYDGVSWSEQQPAGDLDFFWGCVGISGDKMYAAINGGRVYYFDGVSWSEIRPAGDVDKAWVILGISGLKVNIAGEFTRLYYFNGVSWSEQRPQGDFDKVWYGAGVSGDKMIVSNDVGRLYSSEEIEGVIEARTGIYKFKTTS